MDWIHLAQDRGWWRALVNMVMNLQGPQSVGKFLTSCESDRFMELVEERVFSLSFFFYKTVSSWIM
jgi:hypothetical protein